MQIDLKSQYALAEVNRIRESGALRGVKKEYESKFKGLTCVIVGSAPNAVAPDLETINACICVNGSPWAARRLGITIPDLTIVAGFSTLDNKPARRATKSVWDGVRSAEVLYIEAGANAIEGRHSLNSAGFRYDTFNTLTTVERAVIIGDVCGVELGLGSRDSRISNGMFAAALAIWAGAKEIVLVGFSLTGGHSYMENKSEREHLNGDIAFLELSRNFTCKVLTTSTELSDRFSFPMVSLSKQTGKKMFKVRLIGDHSNYHCGSAAAFEVIRAEVEKYGEIIRGEEYDVLVVNGDGSMHHNSSGFQNKMAEIEKAVTRGKPSILMNSVWSDNPSLSADVLQKCEQVIVREVRSAQELEKLGVSRKIMLDQSYFAKIEETEFTDFQGEVVFTDFWSNEFGCFVTLNSKWAQRYTFVDMQKMSWSSLVRSLETASLLVTGRHHAVYAACKAKIPFLALTGNTHKIEGLIETAGIDIPVFESFADLKANLDWPIKNPNIYKSLFEWMDTQPRWTKPNIRGVELGHKI